VPSSSTGEGCASVWPPCAVSSSAWDCREKKSLHASERDTPRVEQARVTYQQRTASLDLRRVKFVDEAGINLAMTRLYGRAPRGERSVGTIPLNDGANITRLGALGVGLQAVMTVEGATDADVFRTCVKQVLGPTLAPGDIVVLDHLSAHKAPGSQQALARRRTRLLYLPPYSPDLSPMELCLSRLKRPCELPRRARKWPSRRRSSRSWRPSPPWMYETGSGIVAMPYSHVKTVLGVAIGVGV
jgi:transposase